MACHTLNRNSTTSLSCMTYSAFLAYKALFPGGLHISIAFVFQRIEGDDLGLDKPALKVAVDFT